MPDRQRMQALTLPLAQLPEVEGREEDTHECVFRSKTQPALAWKSMADCETLPHSLWGDRPYDREPCALADWVWFFCQLDAACSCASGGIPLLWETIQQFLHKEFRDRRDRDPGDCRVGHPGAIPGRSTGRVDALRVAEALEAFALQRARSSLSALAERAPRGCAYLAGRRTDQHSG